MTIRILVGDARDRLRDLPDESVHCVVTSPPYWGLRAYQGDPGMIGLEPTFDEHLTNIVAVFREVRRVLRADGTLWLNYGDAYANDGKWGGSTGGKHAKGLHGQTGIGREKVTTGLKPKDLMMMPARVAMALQADGWWLRSEIVWHKPNPMPESVTDRPTAAHEKVFLLSKRARYWYDAEAVRQPLANGSAERYAYDMQEPAIQNRQPGRERERESRPTEAPSGANLRNVWTIATSPYSEAHFATFPPALVEPCIKAGTSERGVCAACGAPWEQVGNREVVGGAPVRVSPRHDGGDMLDHGTDRSVRHRAGGRVMFETTGWRPTCNCDAGEPVPATVLDPFGGAGTVGLVADRLQRDAVLVEISPEYADMARARIHGDAPLFADVAT